MTVISLLELTLSPAAAADSEGTGRLLTTTLEATRAFDGCLGVEVAVDATDPAHVVVVERWESLEHDDAYRAWRQTPEGASRLAEVLAAPPQLTRTTVMAGV